MSGSGKGIVAGEEGREGGEEVSSRRREEKRSRLERTISKPKDPSIMRSTRSATLAISIMALRSLAHSMKVSRRVLPESREQEGGKVSSGELSGTASSRKQDETDLIPR